MSLKMLRFKYIAYSILTLINYSSCETPFHLDCQYEDKDLGPVVNKVYICKVTNEVIIKERYVKKGTATGDHKLGKSNKDVEVIHAYFKSINYIPDFSVVFENLIGLHLDMCKVFKLTKDELKPYPKLRQLYLHANKLRVLEKDLFIHNPNLGFIQISHNMLREIDPHVFDNLKSLEHLYLYGNECTQMDAKNAQEIAAIVATLDNDCVIKYRAGPVSKPREEHKRVVKEKTSIWKTFGITFGTFAGIVVTVGLLYLIRKIFVN